MLLFGVVGYLMRKLDYPMAPAVLAIVLGPLDIPKLRQIIPISSGFQLIFFTRPFAAVIIVIALIFITLPLMKIIYDKIKKPAAAS